MTKPLLSASSRATTKLCSPPISLKGLNLTMPTFCKVFLLCFLKFSKSRATFLLLSSSLLRCSKISFKFSGVFLVFLKNLIMAEEAGLEPTCLLRGASFRNWCNSRYATPPNDLYLYHFTPQMSKRQTKLFEAKPRTMCGPAGNRTPDLSMPWIRVTPIPRARGAPTRSRTWIPTLGVWCSIH